MGFNLQKMTESMSRAIQFWNLEIGAFKLDTTQQRKLAYRQRILVHNQTIRFRFTFFFDVSSIHRAHFAKRFVVYQTDWNRLNMKIGRDCVDLSIESITSIDWS